MRVIPFISKSQTHTEYLVDNCKQSYTPITIVYIAELLAGVPWTATRARQHIVNELSQALHKILIFNNQNNTPIHKWEQSAWYAQWTLTEEGDHVCTLYSNIAVPEQKLKIRKGREFGWRKTPTGNPGNPDRTSPRPSTRSGRHGSPLASHDRTQRRHPQSDIHNNRSEPI